MSDTRLTRRMRSFGDSIFDEMSSLAKRSGALNLGQGFPDEDGPELVLEAARRAIADGRNQYPPSAGFPELRQAVAAHQEQRYGLSLDPETQVLATFGATEGIAASIMALCEPGDEVVTFEPYYDSYDAMIALAGATRKTCVLRAPDFAIDEAELRAAFSERTRMVVLNTPHNPTGKVFTRAELELIASLAQEHDVVVMADEVYEHLVFDDAVHVPIATLPGMADRALTVGSGGKTFSTTGWKVGWVTGSPELVRDVRIVKQFLTFSGGGPTQLGIAAGLRMGEEYYADFVRSMDIRRHLLVDGLREAGFDVRLPQGTYFALADAAPLGYDDAVELCWQLPELCDVVGVPVGAFHADETANRSLIRFAFCKDADVIREGVRRLQRLPRR